MMTIRVFFLLFSLSLSVTSCNDHNTDPTDIIATIDSDRRFLALGDSYTIGQGVSESDRWPVQLIGLLDNEGVSIDSLHLIAQTGWTTENLNAALSSAQPLEDYDLVTLLIGVNDQYQGSTAEQYSGHFEKLLAIAIDATVSEENVIVISIPDYGVTPFGQNNSEEISLEIDSFNMTARSICLNLGIPFVNVTEISRSLGDEDGALANDNLHPSGTQYGEWAQAILPVALEILE